MKNVKILVLICIIALAIIFRIFAHYSDMSNNKLVNINEIQTDEQFRDITYDRQEDIWQDDVLGILTIEKIGLNATVKEGSDEETLSEYIGHIEGTSVYDGNIGLAGHNRGNKYSYFARLNELKEGDILTYKTKFYTRQYKVNNIQVIYETDWSLLEGTEENKITMITCIANKKEQRLCVQATEILDKDL